MFLFMLTTFARHFHGMSYEQAAIRGLAISLVWVVIGIAWNAGRAFNGPSNYRPFLLPIFAGWFDEQGRLSFLETMLLGLGVAIPIMIVAELPVRYGITSAKKSSSAEAIDPMADADLDGVITSPVSSRPF